MASRQTKRHGIGRLEVVLVLAFIALVFQVFPTLWFGLMWVADVRNWARSAWMAITVGVLLVLFGIRFAPQLYEDWRDRRAESSLNRDKREKQLAAKAERERLEAFRKSRSRRIY